MTTENTREEQLIKTIQNLVATLGIYKMVAKGEIEWPPNIVEVTEERIEAAYVIAYGQQKQQPSKEQTHQAIWDAAQKAEREACAAACEKHIEDPQVIITTSICDNVRTTHIKECAALIRQRGDT